MYEKIVIASGPVIVEDNKVLLNQSSGDAYWKFCGGQPLTNETLQENSQRRVKEEMGIDVKVINPEPFFLFIQQRKKGVEKDIVLIHWLSARIGKINSGLDVQKWDWFMLDKLPENLAPNIIPTLRHFGFIKK